MIPTAAAQLLPAPAAAAPARAASSSVALASSPAVTVPLMPTYNAITVQLQPADKSTSWLDPTILGPLVAAMAILATYIGTARNTTKQLIAARETADRQMDNARDQSRQDRTLQSRKTIFDTFIDDFKRCAHLIGDLPNRDFGKSGPDIEELSGMNATVNKIWLWAEVATVHEVRSLQADINELFIEGMSECVPIRIVKEKLQRVEPMLVRLESERDAYAKQIREFKPDYDSLDRVTAASQRIEQNLHLNLAQATSAITAGCKERAEHWARVVKLQIEYMTFISDRQPQLMSKLTKLMGMARNELGVGGDVSILDDQTEEMMKRVAAAIKQFQDKFKT